MHGSNPLPKNIGVNSFEIEAIPNDNAIEAIIVPSNPLANSKSKDSFDLLFNNATPRGNKTVLIPDIIPIGILITLSALITYIFIITQYSQHCFIHYMIK